MGTSYGVWGAFPVERVRETTCVLRPCGRGHVGSTRAHATPGTVELLQAFTVILGQAVLGGLPDRTLVEGPHDGVRRRGVAQAQCMAKLVNCHRKQVCPLAIWGGRETGWSCSSQERGSEEAPGSGACWQPGTASEVVTASSAQKPPRATSSFLYDFAYSANIFCLAVLDTGILGLNDPQNRLGNGQEETVWLTLMWACPGGGEAGARGAHNSLKEAPALGVSPSQLQPARVSTPRHPSHSHPPWSFHLPSSHLYGPPTASPPHHCSLHPSPQNPQPQHALSDHSLLAWVPSLAPSLSAHGGPPWGPSTGARSKPLNFPGCWPNLSSSSLHKLPAGSHLAGERPKETETVRG